MHRRRTATVISPSKTFLRAATSSGQLARDLWNSVTRLGDEDSGPLFSRRPSEKVGDVLFRLVAAAVITGRVSNEDGDPMQGVQIVALRQPSEDGMDDDAIDLRRHHQVPMESVAAASSDDHGHYRIFGLKPGAYFIRAEDVFVPPAGNIPVDESVWTKLSLGSEYATVYFPSTAQSSQAQLVPVKAGEKAQSDVAMRRVKTVAIVGRVVGVGGPAANALVTLEPDDGGESNFERQDTTDEKGSFHLRNFPEGTYCIWAHQSQEGTWNYETQARQKVEVAGENIDGLRVSLTSGVTLEGKVKAAGLDASALDRLTLSLTSVDEGELAGGHGAVKKDGSFELRSVYDGNYAIGLWGLEPGTYVKSVLHGPDDLLEKGLQAEGNASGQIEVIVASDGAKLDGSVSDDDGPLIGARVRVVPDPLTPYHHLRFQRTTTEQLGHFSLSDLAPGKYTVTAKPMASPKTDGYKAAPQSITLSEGDHKTLELKLEKETEQE